LLAAEGGRRYQGVGLTMQRNAVTVVPEILAPAGSDDAFETALASAADAVYLGLSEGFHARARGAGFDLARLPQLVRRAHHAGVKVYLTLNTLVFERELPELERLLRAVIEAGVDALIVQDPAVALLARELCAELALHASTQMTISSVEGARFAAGLGITRVVLPRELSVKEIARFTQHSPLEAEVFIHGALCMSWSGQCLTSEALSDRSANRGQCSQACRMPYDLIVDGTARDLGDTRYLLSPQDLAGQAALPELIAARVHGLKIEGRYKNAAYVMTAVDSLRNYRDALLAGRTDSAEAQLQRDLARTQLTFSRGASPGFLCGDDHQRLVIGRSPKHRGIRLGRVLQVRGRHVVLELAAGHVEHDPVRAGMGVMFDVGDPEHNDAPGGPVFSVRSLTGLGSARQLELGFGEPGPDLARVHAGVGVWLTGDPELQREAQRRVSQARPGPGRIGVSLRVTGALGAPLCVHAEASFAGRSLHAVAESTAPLTAARTAGLDEALLRAKLAALGGSAFRLTTLALEELGTGLHVPVSELKQLRRALVSTLEAQLSQSPLAVAQPGAGLHTLRARLAPQLAASDEPVQLVPLCRTLEQLEAVIASGCEPGAEVELDFMELVGLRHAVERARSAGLSVTLATVRVQKPGEDSYDRRIAALRPDAVLVRHWGAVRHFADAALAGASARVHGDFSLNVTNSLSARHLLGLGLCTVTASHDLDQSQLLELLAALPAGRVAITLHHHIATFHNSHCVYAHLLSDGSDYRSCGRPCEEHRVALRDFAGHEHPVVVDVGCRNTVFNARAQSAAPLVPRLLERGVRRFRVEFVWEGAVEVQRTLSAYGALLRAETSAATALRQVGVHEQYGVTRLRA
jgi:putative protease